MKVGEKYFKKDMRKLGYKLRRINEERQPYQVWYNKIIIVFIEKIRELYTL